MHAEQAKAKRVGSACSLLRSCPFRRPQESFSHGRSERSEEVEAAMQRHDSGGAIRSFFAGVTEYAFHGRLGVADPALVDYISELLTRFLHRDSLFGLRSTTGQQLDQVVDMLAEAQARQGDACRAIHRHIGDFTLFWIGLYPEALERLRKEGRKDSLIDYRAQGKRAYRIASSIPTESEEPRNEVLEQLSDQFELCAYGLGEVRREWQRRGGPGEMVPLWSN